MFLVSQVSGLVKNSIFVIFSDTTNVMNVRPHNGTKHRALCVRYTFSDLTLIQGHSSVRQLQVKI